MRTIWPALLALAALPAAAGEDCAAVDAATVREIATPRRTEVRLTKTGGGDIAMTIVITGGKWYRRDGPGAAWEVSGFDPAKAKADYRKLVADRHQTCRPDGSETLDGVAADIFMVRRDGGYSKRMWIARGSGLPLRTEDDYASGMHGVEVFDYADVAPPVDH